MTSDPFFHPPREGINSVQRRKTTEKFRLVDLQDRVERLPKGDISSEQISNTGIRRYVVFPNAGRARSEIA
ncbi:hypothetical protein NKK52_30295 [Mesorhizobium sp. C277A]|uniref:hypothetical protein n=1 Tax=Mesorhizobium sp. C277A TaxID=2956827 RepID=UPI0018DB207E|nr:hypothetical protein [Mesorhizobium sp. LSJC277A00]